MTTMRVSVLVTVDIDTDAWRLNFGDMTNVELRKDVKTWARVALREAFDAVGVLK